MDNVRNTFYSFNFSFNLFHPFDSNVYRIHPSFLMLSFFLVLFIYNIKTYLAVTFHMQYKNIHLISDSTDKHSCDSSYSSPMYHTTTKL